MVETGTASVLSSWTSLAVALEVPTALEIGSLEVDWSLSSELVVTTSEVGEVGDSVSVGKILVRVEVGSSCTEVDVIIEVSMSIEDCSIEDRLEAAVATSSDEEVMVVLWVVEEAVKGMGRRRESASQVIEQGSKDQGWRKLSGPSDHLVASWQF